MAHPNSTLTPPDDAPARSGPAPRTVLLIAGAILLAILVLALIAAIATGSVGFDRGRPIHHVVTAPVADTGEATVDLVSGATSVTVRGADLNGDLYRVATPDDSHLVPAVVDPQKRPRAVQVQLTDVGGGGPSAVTIDLARGVKWHVRLTAGATTETVDLRDLAVSAVEFVGGASNIDLSLPRPKGTVPVRMGGGASHFGIHAPTGVPVRVTLGGGAGGVTVDGTTHNGIAAGAAFDSGAWDTATDRYDVQNTAGVSTETVDRL
jgi:hypothetical protein